MRKQLDQATINLDYAIEANNDYLLKKYGGNPPSLTKNERESIKNEILEYKQKQAQDK